MDRDWTRDGRPLPYDEFLRVAEGRSCEWVDGEVVAMSPLSTDHQRIVRFLITLFQVYAEQRRPGVVLFERFQMKLGRVGREPDIMFVLEENRSRLARNHLLGPADLVVEVTSRDSQERDRVEKYAEYEEAGVPEYWLIDPQAREIVTYQLDPDGRYQPADLADGLIRSRVLPGLWLRIEWLWQDPSPKLLSVLEDWGFV